MDLILEQCGSNALVDLILEQCGSNALVDLILEQCGSNALVDLILALVVVDAEAAMGKIQVFAILLALG